jgi:hypothetical protein
LRPKQRLRMPFPFNHIRQSDLTIPQYGVR